MSLLRKFLGFIFLNFGDLRVPNLPSAAFGTRTDSTSAIYRSPSHRRCRLPPCERRRHQPPVTLPPMSPPPLTACDATASVPVLTIGLLSHQDEQMFNFSICHKHFGLFLVFRCEVFYSAFVAYQFQSQMQMNNDSTKHFFCRILNDTHSSNLF